MRIVFSIEECTFGNFKLIGKCDTTNFKEEIEIPKRKISSERYVLRQKVKLNKKHEKHSELIEIIQTAQSKENKTKQNYLNLGLNKKRFSVNENLNLLLKVNYAINGISFISLNYEKYNQHICHWFSVEILRYIPKKNLKSIIEQDLIAEWKVIDEEEKMKGVIRETFEELKFPKLVETNPEPSYIHDTEEQTASRVLFRFDYENKKLCVLLRHLKSGKKELVFAFEEKDLRFRNVINITKEWFTIQYQNNDKLHDGLRKSLLNVRKSKSKAENKNDMISNLIIKLNK